MEDVNKKKIFIVSIILVVVMAAVTVAVMSNVRDDGSESSPKPNNEMTDHAKEARESIDSAAQNESKGNTADAIKDYEKALENYRAANDTLGEEAARMQIEYLKSLNEDEDIEPGPATEKGDDSPY